MWNLIVSEMSPGWNLIPWVEFQKHIFKARSLHNTYRHRIFCNMVSYSAIRFFSLGTIWQVLLADRTIDSSNVVCFVDSVMLFPLFSFALLDEGAKSAYISGWCLRKCWKRFVVLLPLANTPFPQVRQIGFSCSFLITLPSSVAITPKLYQMLLLVFFLRTKNIPSNKLSVILNYTREVV